MPLAERRNHRGVVSARPRRRIRPQQTPALTAWRADFASASGEQDQNGCSRHFDLHSVERPLSRTRIGRVDYTAPGACGQLALGGAQLGVEDQEHCFAMGRCQQHRQAVPGGVVPARHRHFVATEIAPVDFAAAVDAQLIRQPSCLAQRRQPLPQCDQPGDEVRQGEIGPSPVDPGDLVVLAVGVVVAALRCGRVRRRRPASACPVRAAGWPAARAAGGPRSALIAGSVVAPSTPQLTL